MKKRFIGLTEIVFIGFSFILLCAVFVYLSLFASVYNENKWKEIKIPDGITYTQGISILKEEGVVRNEIVFRILGRIFMIDRKLRAGYYTLNTSMTSWDVFNRLRKGLIVQYTITIPEGSMMEDIRLKLKGVRLIDDNSWQLVNSKDFLAFLNIEAPNLEGYLYPDTYSFAKGADPKDIISIMVHRLRANFDKSLIQRAKELNMSEREVLTLASIIEKEARVDSERHIISAVYHNRLKKKMCLQADPTVVYGIKKISDGINRDDLKRQTPYNTYVISGLPPGPIASPGIKSIKAALYPVNVDYVFFVSKNDGTHYFSKTNEEHMSAVMLYQHNSGNINGDTNERETGN